MTASARLLAQPAWRYQLFQALRLLEARLPPGPGLGEGGPAPAERIRLRPSTSLGFPTSEVVEVAAQGQPDGSRRAIVTTNLPGLYGVGSPLPRSYAHQLLLTEEEQPQTRQFLDLLHHRLLSLWYRGWKLRHYEQAFLPGGQDRLSQALLDLLGVQPGATAEDLGTEPVRLLRYLGLLLLRARPAAGLEVLLAEELELPIRVQQHPQRVLTLPREQWSRLAAFPDSGRSGGRLGRDLVVGGRRSDRLTSLGLHIGPVSYCTLLGLAPGGRLHARLVALARFYLRQPLDLILHILVPAAEVGRLRLSSAAPTRLGSPSCLGPSRRDPVVFEFNTSLHPYAAARPKPPSVV